MSYTTYSATDGAIKDIWDDEVSDDDDKTPNKLLFMECPKDDEEGGLE